MRLGLWSAALLMALPTAPALSQAAAGNPLYGGMSEAGRETMAAAMRSVDVKAERQTVEASRSRMLDILEAERLDVPALKRALEDERLAATAQQAKRQQAMLSALPQLSLADRRAFVADARALRQRVERKQAEERVKQQQRLGAAAGLVAPPPQ